MWFVQCLVIQYNRRYMYHLVCATHYSKIFVCIDSLILTKILQGSYCYYPHYTSEGTKARKD